MKTSSRVLVLLFAYFTLLGTPYTHDGWIQSNVARVTVNNMVSTSNNAPTATPSSSTTTLAAVPLTIAPTTTITFDFDTGSPTLATGQNTPLDQTSGGMTARFSSPSDPATFSVQSYDTTFLKLSQFSGKYLYDNKPLRNFLDIKFSHQLNSITLTFATIEYHGGPGVEPSAIKLTAYMNSIGTTPVGSATTRGSWPSGDSYPQGTLSFNSGGQTFNLVRIELPYASGGATEFLVDTVRVTTAPITDTTPPVTTISLSGVLGNLGWYTSDVTISLSATDDLSGVAKTEYSFDNVAWTVYSTPFIVTTEGTTTVYYKSTDSSGNIESAKSQTVKMDKAPSTTAISLSGVLGNAGWYTSTVTVTLSATDSGSGVAKTEYSFDNVAWTVYSTPFVVGSQGANTVYYRSTDVAGNAETFKAQTVKVDTDSPVTTILLSGVPGNVTVTLSAADSVSGVAKTEYSFDNVAWTVYSTPFIVTRRDTTVYYRSTDVAGNVETVRTRTIGGDTTPPVTTVTLSGVLGNQGWHTSNVTVSLSATDDSSGVAKTEFSFDSVTWSTYTTSFIVMNEGTTIVCYRSTDAAGNVEAVKTQAVKIDKTIPTGSVVINDDKASTSSISVTLTLTSNDAYSGVSQVRYSNDGVWDAEQWETPSPTKTWTLTTGNGVKTVYYQIKDNAGLVSLTYQDSIILEATPIVDTIKPVADAGPDQIVNEDALVTFDGSNSTDNVAVISFKWTFTDETTQTLIGVKPTYTFTNPGVYVVTLNVTDEAGNYGIDTMTVTVLDVTPPVISIVSPVNSTYPIRSVPLTFTLSETTSWICYSLDGQANVTVTGNTTLSGLFDTPYRLMIYANDTAGNMGYSNIVYFTVDTISPVAEAGTDQTVNEDTVVTFNGSASVDNVAVTTYTWTFTDVRNIILTGSRSTYTFDSPRVYTITLNVTDAAGNWATDKMAIEVLDVTKPIANAGQNRTVNAGEALSFDAGASSDNVGIVSYEWDCGDGTTDTGRTMTHTYANPGNYTVKLTVEDAARNIATHSITVGVLPAPARSPLSQLVSLWPVLIATAIGIGVAITLFLRKRK